MSKREEFLAAINVFRAASETITPEQRTGLMQQAVHEFGLSTDEASEILAASGLFVGESANYLEMLGLSLDEIQNMNDASIMIRVSAAHRNAYSASLRAGGMPRGDGRTQEQWRTLLNQARDTLTDPQKRQKYIEKLSPQEKTEEKTKQVDESDSIENTTASSSQILLRDTITDASAVQKLSTPDKMPRGMVFIPGGEFLMGTNDGEQVTSDNPLHTVYVGSFFMDKYPVTNRQYKEFLNANPQWHPPSTLYLLNINWIKSKESPEHDGDYLRHWHEIDFPDEIADHPVTWVSWYAAMAYAKWVGKRLPSEAEWEKAARGGVTGQNYPWGSTIDSSMANYHNHIGDTTQVGQYPPNGYGLYDMVGNVWEWCLDVYDEGFYQNSPQKNPISGAGTVNSSPAETPDASKHRVLRGGSWLDGPKLLQSAYRYKNKPTRTLARIGFRCVKAGTA